MSENKAKFELAAKVVGLILVVIGTWMAMDAIALVFSIRDSQKTYEALKIPNEYRQLKRGFDHFERNLWTRVFCILVFESLISIALGFYLMQPDNMFSEFTYPCREKATANRRRRMRSVQHWAMEITKTNNSHYKRGSPGSTGDPPAHFEAHVRARGLKRA
jgi:hypothetical protein